MHPSVKVWVAKKVEELDIAEHSVLELGSRILNGTVRNYFRGSYLGIDMEDGTGVDVVARADDIPFPDEHFQVVVTTEMLEHDPYFWRSIPEAARVLKPGGYLLLTTRGIGFPHHEYPSDYWRFTPEAIRHLFEDSGLEVLEITDDPEPGHPGVFGLARK